MVEIISYKMCAVKVRNAKLRNYLKFSELQMRRSFGGGAQSGAALFKKTFICEL